MEYESAERIPLRLIAEKANVSRMTVSRALRDSPAVSRATRQRIQKIAQRLGYRPDPGLTRLLEAIRFRKQNRQPNVLAYLTAYDQRGGWRRHPTQRICFEGASRRAAECGYRLEEFWVMEPGMTDLRLSQIIRARGIEGVIIAPLPAPRLVLQKFCWEWFSAVEVGYSLALPALHRVCSHQFQSVMLLAEKLHAAGYQRIGLAMSRQHDERVHHHWRAGHLAAHSLWGVGDGRHLMFLSPDWSRDTFQQWLKRCRPDAIITIGPSVGEWLAELDWRVPRDLGLANVDVALDAPGVTGIDQSPQLIGSAAIDLLLSLIQHHERGVPAVPRVTKVQGTFVPGRTIRLLRERAPKAARRR
jgi:LacI family transcriptional regulator